MPTETKPTETTPTETTPTETKPISTTKPYRPSGKSCLTSKGGCRSFAAIPKCKSTKAAIAIAAAIADRKRLAGKSIVVRGSLENLGRGCTKMACGQNECCNRCTSRLLVSGASSSPTWDNSIALKSQGSTNLFACTGDDSITCCAFKPGQQIIATKTMHNTDLVIDSASICVP